MDKETKKKITEKQKKLAEMLLQKEEIEKSETYKDAFEWRFEFPEVLDNDGNFLGFDCIVGNPPYIRQEEFKEIKPYLKENYIETFSSTADIYVYFYEKGYQILNKKGSLCFITSNKWMRANYGLSTRNFFLEKTHIDNLIDFGDTNIFENATTYTNIILFLKNKVKNKRKVFDLSHKFNFDFSLEDNLDQNKHYSDEFSGASFLILKEDSNSIKIKAEKYGVILKNWEININYGIKTGFNEAFIINDKQRHELIRKDSKNSEIIKPIIRGRDIKKYKGDFSNLWLIFTRRGINIENYPIIKDYLQTFYEQLKPKNNNESIGRKAGPYKWFEIQDNIAYFQDFEKEKIIWAEIVFDSAFYIDNQGLFPEATTFLMTGKNLKYLLALLNSKPVTFIFKNFYAGGDLRGNTFRYKKAFLENLPLPQISDGEQKPFIELVDKILENKKQNIYTSDLEKQIDQMVYGLYNLTPEEIAIIESK